MKTFILSLALIALAPSVAIAQNYLTTEEQTYLESINRLLVKNNNPMATTVSDFDKLTYAKNACSQLDDGINMEERSDAFIKKLVSDRALTQDQRLQLINFHTLITVGAVYRFCPEYKYQIDQMSADDK